MLRISTIGSEGPAVTLKLEGRLIGPWVEELRRSCERVLAERDRVTLDLVDVSFIDVDGIALIWSLRDRQVALVNCSPFVEEQLRGGSRCCAGGVTGSP